jgi:hypothetical protein
VPIKPPRSDPRKERRAPAPYADTPASPRHIEPYPGGWKPPSTDIDHRAKKKKAKNKRSSRSRSHEIIHQHFASLTVSDSKLPGMRRAQGTVPIRGGTAGRGRLSCCIDHPSCTTGATPAACRLEVERMPIQSRLWMSDRRFHGRSSRRIRFRLLQSGSCDRDLNDEEALRRWSMTVLSGTYQ